MRLRLSCNSAGDIRLACLRDKADMPKGGRESAHPLVCSSVFQDLRRRILRRYAPGFGTISKRHHMGKEARKTIRQCGAIIDRADRCRVIFLTGTLPGGTQEALMALASWSGWVVQTVTQWIRDFANDSRYFGVWEHQKRGALHLHLCVECPTVAQANDLKRRWKERWIKILDAVGSRAGVDVYARDAGGSWSSQKWRTRVDAQTVEKSVGAYLSKYLSKGNIKAQGQALFPPSAWYFATTRLRQTVSAARRVVTIHQLTPDNCLSLWEQAGAELSACVERCFPYQSPYDGQVRGLIALAKPIHASLLFDYIAGAFRLLGAESEGFIRAGPAFLSDVCTIFGGKIVSECC